MKFEKITSSIKEMIDFAHTKKERDNFLNPGFLLGYGKDSNVFIPMKFTSEERKVQLLPIYMVILAAFEVDMYGGAFTSWHVTSENPVLGVQPRFHPDRIDTVCIIAVSRNQMANRIFKDDQYQLGEEITRGPGEIMSIGGRFTELLAPADKPLPRSERERVIVMGRAAGYFYELVKEADE